MEVSVEALEMALKVIRESKDANDDRKPAWTRSNIEWARWVIAEANLTDA